MKNNKIKIFLLLLAAVGFFSFSKFVNAASAPSVPLNFDVFNRSDTSVSLTWEVPADNGGVAITAYRIYRGPTSGSETFLTEINADTAIFTDTNNISKDQIYYYKISAKNSAGESSQSEEIRVDVVSEAGYYRAVKYVRAELMRFFRPGGGGGSDEQDFICTPFIKICYNGCRSDELRYSGLYNTKNEAITATVNSLEQCLAVNNFQELKDIGKAYRLPIDAYGLGFVDSGKSYRYPYTSATFLYGYGIANNFWYYKDFGQISYNSVTGYLNGVARLVDYANKSYAAIVGVQKVYPENISLRTTRAYDYYYTGSSGTWSVSQESVPTYLFLAEPPSAPVNLSISPVSHGFALSWNPPSTTGGQPVADYNIYRGINDANYVLIKTTNATNYTDENLKVTSEQFYYRVTAVNASGEGEGIVLAAPAIQNIVDLTVQGAGFSSALVPALRVFLINNENNPNQIVSCVNPEYVDSHNMKVKCDIANAAEGYWDVRVLLDTAAPVTLSKAFLVTYPQPENISLGISNTNLSDGILRVDYIKGGALLNNPVVLVGVSGSNPINCYVALNYDAATNQFSGGQCDISNLLKQANGDLSKLEVFVANSFGSLATKFADLSNLNISCAFGNWGSWAPTDPANLCPANTTTRVDNCGHIQSASGTVACTASNQECNASSNQCVCVAGSKFYNGSCCVPKTRDEACGTRQCGNQDDGCGGNIPCGSCTSDYTCNVVSGVCELKRNN